MAEPFSEEVVHVEADGLQVRLWIPSPPERSYEQLVEIAGRLEWMVRLWAKGRKAPRDIAKEASTMFGAAAAEAVYPLAPGQKAGSVYYRDWP